MNKIPTEVDLELLSSLERGEVVTQLSLSRRIGVSIGLVNALLKRAIRKGYVKARAAPYKRYVYYLTPSGFSEKSRLVADYLDISLRFFRDARAQYADGLRWLEVRGWRRVVLVGGGELAEIAILAVRDNEGEVVAVVDAETNRSRVAGVPVVRALDEVGTYDAVVVTDSRCPQATYNFLVEKVGSERVLAPALLRVSELGAGKKGAEEPDRNHELPSSDSAVSQI
ncbi:DNA-binding MarR family transcriptional regulator [Chelatococcus caeni]|uniref:DNA-binding MarR family transcriptional regulator n=1 Tax=Chelatococcus caeni TaxID=1348468 RepID=A0A840BSQ8_9HYPH|nr:winged helix-turn-helix transcriptional regulator [Chelatococcus caeni]MBB4016040.1 DNA-binding MarR family transcriptional regulator [Chelatococcus caeni]